jgi:hypothetical protein
MADEKVWQWERTVGSQAFLISTSKELLPHAFVQEVFAHDDSFWAQPVPADRLATLLANSCTLGMYAVSADGLRDAGVPDGRVCGSGLAGHGAGQVAGAVQPGSPSCGSSCC